MIAMLLAAVLLQDGFAKEADLLIPKLVHESLEERSSALERLKTLAKSDPSVARPLLQERLAAADDEHVKSGLRAALDVLPKLELKAFVAAAAHAGEVPAVRIRLRNISDTEVCVVRRLDASDLGWRYPKFTARILDPEGKDVTPRAEMRCLTMSRVDEGDFTALAPGAEFDPLGDGKHAIWTLDAWKPDRAGIWKVRIEVDYSAADEGEWQGGFPALKGGDIGARARALLARVPREKMVADVEVTVEPAK